MIRMCARNIVNTHRRLLFEMTIGVIARRVGARDGTIGEVDNDGSNLSYFRAVDYMVVVYNTADDIYIVRKNINIEYTNYVMFSPIINMLKLIIYLFVLFRNYQLVLQHVTVLNEKFNLVHIVGRFGWLKDGARSLMTSILGVVMSFFSSTMETLFFS